jgi:hypothetical protein
MSALVFFQHFMLDFRGSTTYSVSATIQFCIPGFGQGAFIGGVGGEPFIARSQVTDVHISRAGSHNITRPEGEAIGDRIIKLSMSISVFSPTFSSEHFPGAFHSYFLSSIGETPEKNSHCWAVSVNVISSTS